MVINHVLILCDYYVSILCGVVGFSFLPFFLGPRGRLRVDWAGLELVVILLPLPPGCV